jgi:glutamyl-tRNA(Gln) amidotransferase subunit D
VERGLILWHGWRKAISNLFIDPSLNLCMGSVKGNSGDLIKIRLARKEISGILLECYDSSVVLLKLESGYNIGVPKEKILDSIIVKKYKVVPLKKVKKEKKKGSKNVGLVITGGTIASKLDVKTGGVSPLTDVEELEKFYPKFFDKVNVKNFDIPFMLASESMNSSHWVKISESVKKMLNNKEIEGVIITHGTDLLHYTSAALSFMLKELNKPVVFTYSQRSIDRASSDADLNLECAADMAVSNVAEVMLVGHGSINDDFCYALLGSKVRKMHTSRRDTFKPINTTPIAKVWTDKIEFLSEYRLRDNKKKVTLDVNFSDKVALVKFYPGQKPEILDYYLKEGYKGLVFEVSGLGHLPVSEAKHNWIAKLKKLIKSGVFVCAAAQTYYGRLNPKVYSNGRELEEIGVVFLEDMLPETAFVKLGWVLGHRGWKVKIKEKMLENISGEFSEMLGE